MRPFDANYILVALKKIIPFIPVTFFIAMSTVILSTLFGFALFRAKNSNSNIFSKISDLYVNLMRCTPTIVLLFVIYYGLPKILIYLFNYDINDFSKGFFVVTTLTLIFSATMSEIIRASFMAIDIGQYEASISIGLSKFQTYTRILIPQMIVVALPNFGNSFIILLKEGALAYTIGLIDVMGEGNLIIARNFGAYAIETYIAVAIIYWILTIFFDKLFLKVEQKLKKGWKQGD